MASVVLKPSERFPIGTSVGAYPRHARHPGLRPAGSAVESQTVDATGTLTFSGLEAETEYWLAAQVAGEWRYILTSTSSYVEPPVALRERIEAQRAAVGA